MINLLIICTNRYIKFLPNLLTSAEKHFLKGQDVEYCIFTDKVEEATSIARPYNAKVFQVEHKPWPWSTLHRFHFFQQYQNELTGAYLFYIDADCMFVNEVGDEILSDLVAVQHCGYVGELGTPETNPKSMAYIAPGENEVYFGGGFLGGKAFNFWDAVDQIASLIDMDSKNGVTAIHHDESHWNRFLVDNQPTKILSPSYHYPENHSHIYSKWRRLGLTFKPKILLLSKDHKKMRG